MDDRNALSALVKRLHVIFVRRNCDTKLCESRADKHVTQFVLQLRIFLRDLQVSATGVSLFVLLFFFLFVCVCVLGEGEGVGVP